MLLPQGQPTPKAAEEKSPRIMVVGCSFESNICEDKAAKTTTV
jgi:hypothetical protein